MHASLRILAGVALAAVGACHDAATTSEADARAMPAAEPSPTSPTPVITAPPPAEPAPAEPTPAVAAPPSAEPTPVEAAPVEAPFDSLAPLRVAALRDGPISIFTRRGAPVLALEGEPVSFVDGAFLRDPTGSAGLWPGLPEIADDSQTLAISGGLQDALGGWATTVQEYSRSAAIYGVYQRIDGAWQAKDLRKGLLVSYYPAFVERDGALLALEGWAPDEDQWVWDGEEGSGADRYQAKLTHALERTKQRWLRLAGAEAAKLPKIPAGMQLGREAMTTDDGTLWALAEEHPASVDEAAQPVLLMWPPGATKAERVPVPDLGEASNLVLRGSGEWVSIAGIIGDLDTGESYLAIGRGRAWQRVPVSLPSRRPDVAANISGAARTPDGTLWIALGSLWNDTRDDESVWRKPAAGEWELVTLPTVRGGAFGPANDWARAPRDEDSGWVEVEREQGPAEPGPVRDLVWAAGAVWIAVDLGRGFESNAEVPSRTALLTTHVGGAPVTVLPPTWQLLLERRNHVRRGAEPGTESCAHFSLVLGPAALATTHPGLVPALRQLAPPEADGGRDAGRIDSIYLGTVDGVEVLVASAHLDSPKRASALRKRASLALRAAGIEGGSAVADCRIPMPTKMLDAVDQR